MKIALTTALSYAVVVVIAVVPAMVTAFSIHSPSTYRPTKMQQHSVSSLLATTTSDEVPDLVKAYAKKGVTKAPMKLPDIIPSDPVDIPPVPPPSDPVVSVPEVTVDSSPLPVTSTTTTPEITPDTIQSAIQGTADQISAQVKSFGLNVKSDDISASFKGMNNFLKSTQEQLAAQAAARQAAAAAATTPGKAPTLAELFQSGVASRRVTFTESSAPIVPEGKAPSLVQFMTSGFKTSAAAGGVSTDNLAESKAKLGLLIDNTYSLFGSTTGSIDWSSVSFPGAITPEMAAGAFVAFLFLLGLASKSADTPSTPLESTTVILDKEGTSAELFGSVAAEDKTGIQMKALRDETENLRSELKEAREKLTKKELAISKERLNTADMELQLKREIQRINLQLQASERAKKALEKKLATSKGVKGEKVKAAAPEPVVEAMEVEAVEVEVPAAAVVEVSVPDIVSAETVVVAEPVEVPKPSPAPKAKAAPAKKAAAAPKKAAVKKVEAKVVEVPKVVEVEAPKAAAPTPKATPAPKTKAKATKAAAAPQVDSATATKGDDWSSLSAAALSRKTVKELSEYLSSKGVKTVGDDGKPLTKALMVNAVRSL